jgi:hypothetical protein
MMAPVMNLRLIPLFVFLAFSNARGTQFYVSPVGSDSNPGTIDLPFLTITKAVSQPATIFKPGDTVVVRGGVHTFGATINITGSGSAAAHYHLIAFAGERPILNFSSMPVASTNRGINLKGSYWTVKGIDIKGAGDNGINISGSNNIIEFCSLYENRDTGLQLGGGASNNLIINCDSYFNADPGQGNADGFAPKLDVGTQNFFYGCRSWQNSDDGWDGYLRGASDVSTTLENCWCFMNGFLKDGTQSAGNGNGYKMGGSDTKDLKHNFILKKCLAFDNRVKGFDQNSNRGSMTLYNCTGYRNGKNYSIADTLAPGKVLALANCVALGSYGELNSRAIEQTNSWMSPFVPVTPADIISIDTAGMRGPRKSDGSLPDVTFLFPARGSQLIDAGTDVGLPFNGSKPDLGVFETVALVGIRDDIQCMPGGFRILQNYPNPFNLATTIAYAIPIPGEVTLEVFDLNGRVIRTLVRNHHEGGQYRVVWDGSTDSALPVSSGVYFLRLEYRKDARTLKILLVK